MAVRVYSNDTGGEHDDCPGTISANLCALRSTLTSSRIEVYTDSLRSYSDLNYDYMHNVINHAEKYVEGNVHTNGSKTTRVC